MLQVFKREQASILHSIHIMPQAETTSKYFGNIHTPYKMLDRSAHGQTSTVARTTPSTMHFTSPVSDAKEPMSAPTH